MQSELIHIDATINPELIADSLMIISVMLEKMLIKI